MTEKLPIAVVVFFVCLHTISGQRVDNGLPTELQNMTNKAICIKNANGEFLYADGTTFKEGFRKVYSTSNIKKLKDEIQWEITLADGKAANIKSKKYGSNFYEVVDDNAASDGYEHLLSAVDPSISNYDKKNAEFQFKWTGVSDSGEPMYVIHNKNSKFYLNAPLGEKPSTAFENYYEPPILMLNRNLEAITSMFSTWSIGDCPSLRRVPASLKPMNYVKK